MSSKLERETSGSHTARQTRTHTHTHTHTHRERERGSGSRSQPEASAHRLQERERERERERGGGGGDLVVATPEASAHWLQAGKRPQWGREARLREDVGARACSGNHTCSRARRIIDRRTVRMSTIPPCSAKLLVQSPNMCAHNRPPGGTLPRAPCLRSRRVEETQKQNESRSAGGERRIPPDTP